MVLAVVFGVCLGGLLAGAVVVLAARARGPVEVPQPPDTGELLARLLDANRALMEQERLRATAELDGKKGLIDQQLVSMTGELGKVSDLVRELEHDRHKAFGQLTNELQRQHAGLNALSEHTQQLREALANSRARGQWGERMAEDVLQLAGFLEGVNYRKQSTLAGAGRPDYTFLLPNGLVMHMDVKFPLDNYVRHLEADNDVERARYRDQFLRDVRDRVKELTTRGYLDAADETVDCLLLFIPNEQVYAFVQEHDRDAHRRRDAAQDRAVLAAHALRGARGRAPGRRQLPARAHVQRDPRAAARLLVAVGEVHGPTRSGPATLRRCGQGVRGADDHPAPRAAAPARQDRLAAPRGTGVGRPRDRCRSRSKPEPIRRDR